MDERTRRVLHSGQRGDWETPPDLFQALHWEFRFAIDAAATAANKLVPYWWGPDSPYRQDALSDPWRCGQNIFCNPPYGRQIRAWLERGSESEAPATVFLLPARTDTRWFHELVAGKAEVRFLAGRLRFRLNGNVLAPAPFPSMVVIWRRDAEWTHA